MYMWPSSPCFKSIGFLCNMYIQVQIVPYMKRMLDFNSSIQILCYNKIYPTRFLRNSFVVIVLFEKGHIDQNR